MNLLSILAKRGNLTHNAFLFAGNYPMSRHVYCLKLQQNSIGLDTTPFPGPVGEKIFNHISKAAWKMWLDHQTMLINEYRLSLIDPKARTFLKEEMEKFFFGTGSDKPQGFVPKD